jgi:proteasome accessory factor B
MSAGAGGPSEKTERLLNLTCVLLGTRRPLAKAAIRKAVPQYAGAASDEAFDRMFERDKDELRGLGIPLVTEDIDTIWDSEPGYRIEAKDYALPEIEFAPDELAVLGLASRAWAQASLAGPAAQALRKLQAAGVEAGEGALIGLEARLRTPDPAFDSLLDALQRRVAVSFDYRRPEAPAAERRRVQPWALLSWHGHWYLTGFDEDRGEARVFRLSRIESDVKAGRSSGSYTVPADHDARAMVARTVQPVGTPAPSPAVLRVRTGRGYALRRRARTVGDVDERWSLVDLDYTDLDAFADELAGYGPDVVVEQPYELRDLVVRRLSSALAAHGGQGGGEF